MEWPDEREHVACDLCGRDDPQPLFLRPDGLQAVECPHCGLAYIDPRPTQAVLYRLYDEGYFSDDREGRFAGRTVHTSGQAYSYRKVAEQRLNVLKKSVSLPGKRLLELGSGEGYFTALAQENGCEAVGIDLNSHAVEEARERFPGVVFEVGDTMSLGLPDESFDCICAFELIEHVTSPSDFLAEMKRLLRPGGTLMLSTPNMASGRALGVSQWIGFHMSWEHIYFLEPKTMQALAEKAGLALTETLTHGSGNVPRKRTLRGTLRAMADRLGVLALARKLRDYVRDVGSVQHAPSQTGHNMICIMTREETSTP